MLDDVPILVAKTIVIRKALRTTVHLKLDNLLIESDSLIVINSILAKSNVSTHIANLIADIVDSQF